MEHLRQIFPRMYRHRTLGHVAEYPDKYFISGDRGRTISMHYSSPEPGDATDDSRRVSEQQRCAALRRSIP